MVYVHLATGFEEVEALSVIDILRRGQVNAKLVSVQEELMVTGAHGITVTADLLFDEADYKDCEMIVLPGGMPGTHGLQNHKGLEEKIIDFNEKGKKISAICAAPMILGGLGILDGKKATIYPSMEGYLGEAICCQEKVVEDGNIVTSKGPGTAMEFALVLLEVLKGKEIASEIRKDVLLG